MTAIVTNYIYLLQEREFIKTNENIYKIGMTKKENYTRFNQYPNGSILLFQMICNDCKTMEKIILKTFYGNFKQRKEIGSEYFEGDYTSMIDIIYSAIKNELPKSESNVSLNKNDDSDSIRDDEYWGALQDDIDSIRDYEYWGSYCKL